MGHSMRALFGVIAFWFAAPVVAIDSNTNCERECKKFGLRDPACEVDCELKKRLAGNRIFLPHIEPPDPLAMACNGPYDTLTNSVIANCSNWAGRIDDQDLIENAANLLKDEGIIDANELRGIQVRWCPLSRASGMAPDRGRIYLNPSLKPNPFQTAVVLAHEIRHLRQYRELGSDRFKCEYSRQYVECGGCQDRRHLHERQAYDFESEVARRLQASAQKTNATALPSGAPEDIAVTQDLISSKSDKVTGAEVMSTGNRTRHSIVQKSSAGITSTRIRVPTGATGFRTYVGYQWQAACDPDGGVPHGMHVSVWADGRKVAGEDIRYTYGDGNAKFFDVRLAPGTSSLELRNEMKAGRWCATFVWGNPIFTVIR